MQIKTAMRCHLSPSGMAIIKKTRGHHGPLDTGRPAQAGASSAPEMRGTGCPGSPGFPSCYWKDQTEK